VTLLSVTVRRHVCCVHANREHSPCSRVMSTHYRCSWAMFTGSVNVDMSTGSVNWQKKLTQNLFDFEFHFQDIQKTFVKCVSLATLVAFYASQHF